MKIKFYDRFHFGWRTQKRGCLKMYLQGMTRVSFPGLFLKNAIRNGMPFPTSIFSLYMHFRGRRMHFETLPLFTIHSSLFCNKVFARLCLALSVILWYNESIDAEYVQVQIFARHFTVTALLISLPNFKLHLKNVPKVNTGQSISVKVAIMISQRIVLKLKSCQLLQ